MKKVICLIESLQSGGAERQMAYLATLLNTEYNVELWTYYPHDFYLPVLKNNNVKYRYIKEAQDKKTRIFRIYSLLKKEKPDVVIAYLDTATTVVSLCKILGCRFKLIVSERNTTQNLSKREYIKFFLYRFADVIVPNSFTQTSFIRTNYPRLSRKLVTITNYVDTEKFHPSKNVQKWSDMDGRLHLISVGRLMPQKNIIGFVNAMKILKDKGIDIVCHWFGGTVDSKYYMAILTAIENNGIKDSFVLHEPSRSIYEEYQKADAFCLPSFYEGFPNVVCEAMSSGLPILTSNVCDNPQIIRDGINGFLFDPTNIYDIVEKIEKYYNIPHEQKQRMSVLSRKIAEEKFSEEKFVELYNQIIK